MKKVFLALLFISGVAIGVTAQDNIDFSSLNNSQTDRIKSIQIEYTDKFSIVDNDSSLTNEQKSNKKKALILDKNRKVQAVIDDPQLEIEDNRTEKEYSISYDESKLGRKQTKEEAMARITQQIKQDEEKYKVDEEALKKSSIDKTEYNRRREALKNEHLRRVARLKTEMEAVKASYEHQ